GGPKGDHDRRGGGPAHSGLMVYLADQWPADYRGKLLTLNFHGRRVNVERLERAGSGYVGRHEPDMLFAADPWFRGIDLAYGPDGGVFLLDWSDTRDCHDHDGVHRTSGPIYKATYRASRSATWRRLTKNGCWPCTGTRMNGSSARLGACWPSDRRGASPSISPRRRSAPCSTRTPIRCGSSGPCGPCPSSAEPTNASSA